MVRTEIKFRGRSVRAKFMRVRAGTSVCGWGTEGECLGSKGECLGNALTLPGECLGNA
jgi:hypothetical protein